MKKPKTQAGVELIVVAEVPVQDNPSRSHFAQIIFDGKEAFELPVAKDRAE